MPSGKLALRMRLTNIPRCPTQPRLYPIAAIFSETFIRQRTGSFFLKGEAATQIIYHFSPQELAALGTERPEQEGGGPGGGGIRSRLLLRLLRTLEGTAAPRGGRCARSRQGGAREAEKRCVLSPPQPSPALPLPPPLA